MSRSQRDLPHYIEHTCLRKDTTKEHIAKLCGEALQYGFFGVCVPLEFVADAKQHLEGAQTQIITVVGFPTGEEPSQQKEAQTRQAVEAGASEVDMVLCRSRLLARDYQYVLDDVKRVVNEARARRVKVILETSELSYEHIIVASCLAVAAGAAFLKTSTGFAPGGGGATVEAVTLMRQWAPNHVGIKASGGIAHWEQAQKLILAGASRLGCSRSLTLLEEAQLGAAAGTPSQATSRESV